MKTGNRVDQLLYNRLNGAVQATPPPFRRASLRPLRTRDSAGQRPGRPAGSGPASAAAKPMMTGCGARIAAVPAAVADKMLAFPLPPAGEIFTGAGRAGGVTADLATGSTMIRSSVEAGVPNSGAIE